MDLGRPQKILQRPPRLERGFASRAAGKRCSISSGAPIFFQARASFAFLNSLSAGRHESQA